MAVEYLRQVMAAFLTASMFLMLGNMIKRDHIDPLLENTRASPSFQYDVLKVSKQSLVEPAGAGSGLWTEDNHHAPKPCWKKPSWKGRDQEPRGYIFFSLTNGPEYHVSQIANAVLVATHLGAALVLPEIRGSIAGEKRQFGEVYDVRKFITSLNGVVQVVKSQPVEVHKEKITTVRVPNRVSADYIASKIKPVFGSGRNLRLVTHLPSLTLVEAKGTNTANPYKCLVMFQTLELQQELKQLANSMIGTLRSLSRRTHGQFIAVDLSVETLGKTGCQENVTGNKTCDVAGEIGRFLKKIGFHGDTAIYLTQSGWDSSLNALRVAFPNTFTKDGVMPVDGKARFLDSESSEARKVIDLYICTQSDVFVPVCSNLFYTIVAGKRISSGKTQILVPAARASTFANDYMSPYITKRSHIAYSCYC